MKEQEQLIQNRNLIDELSSRERPIINTWATNCIPTLRTRERLANEITNGIIPMQGEVPNFLLPIMRRWAKEGPVILTSYSHPEEFETYSVMAHLNLVLFLEQIKKQGISVPKDKVMENWYETVALSRSVTEPLNVGETFPRDKLKADILGITGRRFGSESIDCDKQAAILEQVDGERISQAIVDRLTNNLDEELKSSMSTLTRKERHEMRQVTIKDLIFQRLSIIIGLVSSRLLEIRSKDKPTINDFLIDLEQKLSGLILDNQGEYGSPRKIGSITGIDGILSSKNESYLNLVIGTLELIIEAKGIKVLKDLVNSTGEGLFLGVVEGEDMLLTVNKETERFILMNKKSYSTEQVVQDQELIDFIRIKGFLPLAKPEILTLVASGMVLHMGSEHGNRARALNVLGINEERSPIFYAYLNSLRIGQDLEQGNNLFAVQGSQSIPTLLAFLLLGKNFLRSKMLEMAGVGFKPEALSDKDFRKLAAKSLVSDAKQLKEKGSSNQGKYKNSQGGFLWF